MKRFILFPIFWVVCFSNVWGQGENTQDDLPQSIPLGEGSYASRPPRDQAARPGLPGKSGWGDASQVFTHMKLFVTNGHKEAIPSTKWWTSLVVQRWSGQLWSYPSMVKAEPSGVGIYFPKTWKLAGDGKTMNMAWSSKLLVRGAGFKPESADAESWSDWLLTFRMAQSPRSYFRVTIGHGLPCTWIETSGVDVRIDAENPQFFGSSTTLPFSGTALGVQSNGDCYGLFVPEGTQFSQDGTSIALHFAGRQSWLVVAVMPAQNDLATFAKYASVIPRSTQVAWDYSPEKGQVATAWTLDTENLAGGPERDVIQGWIPHHYNTARGAQPDFTFNGMTYATPRGELRCAVGHTFGITYPFRGLLPELPAPRVVQNQPNPYRPEVMRSLLDNYTSETDYGTETYWGGKKILLFAKYMEMSHQTGQKADEAIFRQRLEGALTDWFTYEPGKMLHFYAMYPNWGSLIGFRTRDNANPGIDYLQDHAFCYGYHLYSAALLCAHDPVFAKAYGPMARLVAKDFGNWERDDLRFPFFRSLDLWEGHSYSGGLGGEEGNGEESSSEGVQAWGAIATLGSALNDKPMRDAGIFAYTLETHGVGEYWFDRDKKNIPRDLWPHPYCSNLGSNGVGWWTWFSGDQYWMHSIQWLPMSPFLKYLGEDQAFARWDYETMWKDKSVGGWDSNLGNEPGVGNVTLSYLQLFDPDQAAKIFDDLWDNNRGTAHAKDESGPTYYRIHAGRSMGTIKWDAWTDIPTSTVYQDAAGHDIAAVYNMTDEEKECHVYDKGTLVATIRVPAHQLIAHALDSKPASIEITPTVTIEPGKTALLKARVLDQYGASMDGKIQWSVATGAAIDSTGQFQAPTKGSYVVTATSGALSANQSVRVDDAPVPTKIVLQPAITSLELGAKIPIQAICQDQYGDRVSQPVTLSATDGGLVDDYGYLHANSGASLTLAATCGSLSVKFPIAVRPPLGDLALGKAVTALSGIDSAKLAFDGSPDTRWESDHSDNQWIAVDLGMPCQMDHVKLNWENAYGKTYEIQLSNDGQNWKTAFTQNNGTGGEEVAAISGTARWVRMLGKTRGTDYGFSLFSMEVYGVPASGGNQPILSSIIVNPTVALITDQQTAQFSCTGFDQFGHVIAFQPEWSLDFSQGGTIDSNGLFKPAMGGVYDHSRFGILCRANGVQGEGWAAVEESRRVKKIELTPDPKSALKIIAGTPLQLTAEVQDQFTARYDAPLQWTAQGAVSVNSTGLVMGNKVGDGRVKVSSGDVTKEIKFSVVSPESFSITTSKPVQASGVVEGNNPEKAVDGDPNSRWGSPFSDPQWISVDMGAEYNVKSVVTNWERASAKCFQIQFSDDGSHWITALEVTDGHEGIQKYQVTAIGRYLRLYCTQRNTGYGYSLFELEAYGTLIK